MILQIKLQEENSKLIDTPISISLDLQLLKESGDPEQRSLSELVSMVSELHKYTQSLEHLFRHPELLIPKSYLREIATSIHKSKLSEITFPPELEALSDELSRELADRLELGEPNSFDQTHEMRIKMDRLRQLLNGVRNKYL